MYQPLPTSESSSFSSLAAYSSTSPPPSSRRHRLSGDSCVVLSLSLLLVTSVLLFFCTVYQVHKQLRSDADTARQWIERDGSNVLHLSASSTVRPAHTLSRPIDAQEADPAGRAEQRTADAAEDALYYSDHELVPVATIEKQASTILSAHAAQLIPSPPLEFNLSTIPAHLSHYSVLWDFGGVGCSGFAVEAGNLLYGLSLFMPTSSLYVIRSAHACPGLPWYVHSLLTELSQKLPPASLDILVSHKPPPQYPLFPYYSYDRYITQRPAYVIGRSMTEVHRVPREWGERVNERVDECWLTSSRQVPPFLLGGAEAKRLWVVGEPLDVPMWDDEAGRQQMQRLQKTDTHTGKTKNSSGLVIEELEERKGWKELVYAFMKEFSADEDVALFIHTYLHASFDQRNPYRVQQALLEHIRSLNLSSNPSPPYSSVHVITQLIPTVWLPRFYAAFSTFVLPTHGEGWCLPMAEALLSGLPLLATNASTHLEYVHEGNAQLLPVAGYEVARGAEWDNDRGPDEEKALWPTVSVSGLRRAMRRVASEGTKQGQLAETRRRQRGQEEMRRSYSVEAVAERMVRRLYEITQLIDTKQNRTRGVV